MKYYGVGLPDKSSILIHSVPIVGGYSLTPADQIDRFSFWRPVMLSTPSEIDQVMQDYSTNTGFYNLKVFEFTEEEVIHYLLKKLKA